MRMRALIHLCSIVLVLVSARSAEAQGSTSYGLFGDADFRPAIGTAQMAVIVRALGLDEGEAALAGDLHDALGARVRREGAEIRREIVELIEEAQLLGRADHVDELYEIRDEWGKRKDRFDQDFFDELKLILSDEQLSRWSIVERELRRMELIWRGRMAGESVDLTLLVENEGVPMTDGLVGVLERYAEAMDNALRARVSFFEDHPQSEQRELLERDPEKAARQFERARSAREAVRDVNARFVPLVAQAMGPEAGADLRAAWIKSVTNTAHHASTAQEAIDGAQGLRSLTEQQATMLELINERYEEEFAAWLEKYAAVVMEVESEAVPFPIQRAIGAMPARDPERDPRIREVNERSQVPELERIWRARLNLDRATRREVQALLTPEQRERMPLLIRHLTIGTGEVYGAGDRSWY